MTTHLNTINCQTFGEQSSAAVAASARRLYLPVVAAARHPLLHVARVLPRSAAPAGQRKHTLDVLSRDRCDAMPVPKTCRMRRLVPFDNGSIVAWLRGINSPCRLAWHLCAIDHPPLGLILLLLVSVVGCCRM
jgi:hypothetical protein